MNSRRAILLLLTLITLALVAALIVPLAQTSGLAAVGASRQADDLRHRLAAHSVVAVLPQLLAAREDLRRALDQTNRALFTLRLADDLTVEVALQDDSAKLPLGRLQIDRLTSLGSRLGLPELAPVADGKAYCIEDLFAYPTDAAVYSTIERGGAWAGYLTALGDQVQVWRAAPAVITTALADQDERFVGNLIQSRFASQTIEDLLTRVESTPAQARAVRERLIDRTLRHSLLVRSTIGRQSRQRYLIVSAEAAPRILAEWEVAP